MASTATATTTTVAPALPRVLLQASLKPRPRPSLPHLSDLDVLESPAISPAAPTGMFAVPSALLPPHAKAERIFNDPDSWGVEGEDDEDASDLEFELEGLDELGWEDVEGDGEDPMAWFQEEVDRFRLASAGSSVTAFSEATSDEGESVPLGLDDVRFVPIKDGVKSKRKRRSEGLRPISLAAFFEHSGEEVQQRVVKMILEEGRGLGVPPGFEGAQKGVLDLVGLTSSSSSSSSSSSASLASGSSSSSGYPSAVSSSSSLEAVATPSTAATTGTDGVSPVAVHSASATLSFLEWYGIYPDTPASAASFRKSIHLKKAQQQQQAAGTPPASATPPSATLMKRKPSRKRVVSPRIVIPGHTKAKGGAVGLARQKSMNLGAALMSPSVLYPDLRVEPPKRGSGVPPLGEMRGVLKDIFVQAQQQNQPEPRAEERADPVNPPGLEVVKRGKEDAKETAPPLPVLEKKEDVPSPFKKVVKNEESKTPVSTPQKTRTPLATPSPAQSKSTTSTPLKSGIMKSGTPTPQSTPTPAAKTKKSSTTPASTPPKKLPRAMLETQRRKPNMEIRVTKNEENEEEPRSHQPRPSLQQQYQKQAQVPSTAVAPKAPPMRSALPMPQPMTAAPNRANTQQQQQAPVTATHGVLRRLPSIPPPQQPATAVPASTTVTRAVTPPHPLPEIPPAQQQPATAAPAPAAVIPRASTPPTSVAVNPVAQPATAAAAATPAQPSPGPKSGVLHAPRTTSNLAMLAGLRQAQMRQPASAMTSASSVLSPPASGLPSAASSMGMGLGGLGSPEATPGQTITFFGSRMSGVRSPMGGPAGPRLRGPRVSTPSGLRKPPGLEL